MMVMFMQNRFHELRKGKHCSQIQLQIALGIDQSDISRIESGQKIPTPEQCKRAALFFGTSIDFIMCLTQERRPHTRSGSPLSPDYLRKRMGDVAKLRKKYYTQAQIGQLIGMNQSNISKVELGKRYLSTEQYIKLAQYLGTSVDYLCALTDNLSPYPTLP